ncbi:DUF4124 domain-containing protein [Shewanella corallii]|uniref:DUF4124 domain-containing protein n=1 Tax=Shewanella corallii TaxID=560080 RepID=A0ABT0NCK3_9GAMM|nr:DUF4124 domain-containing protein [Shewanella corallii]MCL2915835.1 DUF4124 domain-containing protein [Shewanella corallii]
MTTLLKLVALQIMIAGMLLSTTTNANDIIYTWVDENGTKHYSQLPPEGEYEVTRLNHQDLEPKRIGTVSPVRAVAKAKPATEDDLTKQADEIKAQNAEQAKSICDNAKHTLNVLLTHAQVTRKDESNGEMVTMTQEQKQAAIKESQERVKLFCEE